MAIALTMNEKNVDVSKVYTGGVYVPAGWYKLALVDEEKEKRSTSGRTLGAKFIFQIEDGTYAGTKIKIWFATRAIVTTDNWQVEKTNAFCLRIA